MKSIKYWRQVINIQEMQSVSSIMHFEIQKVEFQSITRGRMNGNSIEYNYIKNQSN